jgi:hypothetical protein
VPEIWKEEEIEVMSARKQQKAERTVTHGSYESPEIAKGRKNGHS